MCVDIDSREFATSIPIERVWRDLKEALAWLQFTTLEAQQAYMGDLLRAYHTSTLQSLTRYAYVVEAIHA